MTDLELRFYTATVILEAGGEGNKGMAAVAWVIRNRVTRKGYPNGILQVCLDPLQFSCWNGDHKRRAQALLDESEVHRRAQKICIDVWSGALPDPTDGATHYHTLAVKPSWRKVLKKLVTIKNHIFYLEDRG